MWFQLGKDIKKRLSHLIREEERLSYWQAYLRKGNQLFDGRIHDHHDGVFHMVVTFLRWRFQHGLSWDDFSKHLLLLAAWLAWENNSFPNYDSISITSQPLLILPSCSSVDGHLGKWSRRTSHERGTFQALNHFTLRSWDCCRFEYSYIVWAYLLVLAPLPVLTQSLVDTCGPEVSPYLREVCLSVG